MDEMVSSQSSEGGDSQTIPMEDQLKVIEEEMANGRAGTTHRGIVFFYSVLFFFSYFLLFCFVFFMLGIFLPGLHCLLYRVRECSKTAGKTKGWCTRVP